MSIDFSKLSRDERMSSFYESEENPHSVAVAQELGFETSVTFVPTHEGRNYLVWVRGEGRLEWSLFDDYQATRARKGKEVSLYQVCQAGNPCKGYREQWLTEEEAAAIEKDGTPIQKTVG